MMGLKSLAGWSGLASREDSWTIIKHLPEVLRVLIRGFNG